tara:strand:+ start:1533 stop:1745 length:213 start_codon:yes stop_codon:yes gene_type:complete
MKINKLKNIIKEELRKIKLNENMIKIKCFCDKQGTSCSGTWQGGHPPVVDCACCDHITKIAHDSDRKFIP